MLPPLADPNTPTPLTTMPTPPDRVPVLELTMLPANVATPATTIAALVAAMLPEFAMLPANVLTPATRIPLPNGAEIVPLFVIPPRKVPTPPTKMPSPSAAAIVPLLTMPLPAPADPNTPTPLTTMPTAPDMLPELELTMPPANLATFVTTIAALVAAMVPELVMPPLTKVTPQPQPTRMPVPAEMVPLF